MKFKTNLNAKISHFLIEPSRRVLKDIGFEEDQSLMVDITNSRNNIFKVLEILSIITLEVFRINGVKRYTCDLNK